MDYHDSEEEEDDDDSYIPSDEYTSEDEDEDEESDDSESESESEYSSSDDDDDETEQVRLELLREQVQICSSVLGARHWTTNILLLLHLDRSLQEIHGVMLQGGSDDNMDRIAECIDMLERLFRFVEGLGLKLDPAHLLSDVTVGVARALVSLGDDKSKAYGAQWMEKITDLHLEHFGEMGMRKVGQALRNAGQPPAKKARHS